MKRLISLFAFFCILFSAVPVSAQETWALSSEQANCIIENLENYLAESENPIVIFVQACPIADRMEALQALQKNSGALPSVTVSNDGALLDQVIVYTSEELSCLRNLELELTSSPVLLPQNPCGS